MLSLFKENIKRFSLSKFISNEKVKNAAMVCKKNLYDCFIAVFKLMNGTVCYLYSASSYSILSSYAALILLINE